MIILLCKVSVPHSMCYSCYGNWVWGGKILVIIMGFVDMLGKYFIAQFWLLDNLTCILSFPTGLFRPGTSREGPGRGRDRTGPRDLEGPVVPWYRDQRSPKVPGLFLKVPGRPGGPFFLYFALERHGKKIWKILEESCVKWYISYILRRPQNFTKSPSYFCLIVL